MRRRWFVLLAAALCIGPVAARADIVQPSPLPAAVADRDDLASARADLMAAWQGLEQAIAAHNARCSEVAEDSPQEEACLSRQVAILSNVEAYKEQLQRYEDALGKASRAAQAPQPAAVTRYLRAVACAVEPLTRQAASMGEEGQRFAAMVQEAIEQHRGELAQAPPDTYLPLHIDHHPGASQFLADINMARRADGGWRLDVLYSLAKTAGEEEVAGESRLTLGQDGQLLTSEAPDDVQRCVENP